MPIIADQTAAAWRDHVDFWIEAGWRPYILSFMFEPLRGNQASKMRQMERLVEVAYGIFVTRVVRNPASPVNQGFLPVWICSPDLPVFKRRKEAKARLHDVVVNDGLHYHAILLLPPRSRVDDLAEHFGRLRSTYRRLAQLDRVDVEPIIDTERDPVGYVLKQSMKGNFDVGDHFVLPRALKELAA